jgi:hypothetical protein
MEAELKDVGDQALVRGLATAFPIVRPGLSYLTCGRRPGPATKRLTGHSLPLSRLLPCAGMFIAEAIRSGCVRFPGDSPHETDQFTGDCSADHGRPFAPTA